MMSEDDLPRVASFHLAFSLAVCMFLVGLWKAVYLLPLCAAFNCSKMQAGVAMTIEPGLYIPNDPAKFGKYAGIGVRIEVLMSC